MKSFSGLLAASIVVSAPLAARADTPVAIDLDVHKWRVVERESGKVMYYSVVENKEMPFLRARYTPPTETMVLGVQIADGDRARARSLKWKWRAMTLPNGGNECADGKGDSAAVLYVTWKRGLRWYTIKYVWSSVGPKGSTCDKKRNPFVAQDTFVLESGGPTNVWKDESIDLKSEFRKHFEGGDANAEVPDFVGVGLMTDGDDTASESAADYAGFVLER